MASVEVVRGAVKAGRCTLNPKPKTLDPRP